MFLFRFLCFVLLVGLSVHSGSGVADEPAAGIVMTVSGSVEVVRDQEALPLAPGDTIYAGDTLVTDTDGSLGVTLKDNTLLSLGPASSFKLVNFELDPVAEEFSLIGEILRGSLVVTTGDIGDIAPENVVFETPLGLIGIRGTRFAVSVS